MRLLLNTALLVACALATGAFGASCLLKADGFTGGVADAGGDSSSAGDSGGSSGSSGGSSGSSGSSGGSSGTSGDAGNDGGPNPGVNLLTNGDFELGCAGWDVSFGFISEATDMTTSHSGTHSCKLCMDTNFEATLQQDVPHPVKMGEKYYGEVWLRAASIPPTAGFVGDGLNILTKTDIDGTDGPFPLTNSYVRLTAVMEIPADSPHVALQVHLQQSGNPASQGNVICVYVDDAILRPL